MIEQRDSAYSQTLHPTINGNAEATFEPIEAIGDNQVPVSHDSSDGSTSDGNVPRRPL